MTIIRVKLPRMIALLALLPIAISGCVMGDDVRVVGRVTSVSSTSVCVAPVGRTSGNEQCRGVPEGATVLPSVGQCVSLILYGADAGKVKLWETKSLAEHVPDATCDETSSS